MSHFIKAFGFFALTTSLLMSGAVNVSAQEGVAINVPQRNVSAGAVTQDFSGFAGKRYTLVRRKVDSLQADVINLIQTLDDHRGQLLALNRANYRLASDYYGQIGAISTELQSGTTPGNPILIENWNEAQHRLDILAQGVARLNNLASQVAQEASLALFLLDSVQNTYNLSGAVKEDHEVLKNVEDQVNQLVVKLERLQNEVSDSIRRSRGYLEAERRNMQTLSLAIATGDSFGRSLSNRPFQSFGSLDQAAASAATASAATTPVAQGPSRSAGFVPDRKPLVKIRFDRPTVRYQQSLYNAVSQALERFPAAQLDLVAVNPVQGNAADVALASAQSRRYAEDVLRTLTDMGVPSDRIRLAAASSAQASVSEVHVFIR